jgi:hypothetical protein
MQPSYRLDNGWSLSGTSEIRYDEINFGRALVKSKLDLQGLLMGSLLHRG